CALPISGDAVGGDDERRAVGDRFAFDAGGDSGDAPGEVEERGGDLDAGPQGGAGRHGPFGEQLVEVVPGAGQAVVREALEGGPVQFDGGVVGDDAQAAVAGPAGRFGGVDPHLDQLGD